MGIVNCFPIGSFKKIPKTLPDFDCINPILGFGSFINGTVFFEVYQNNL